jgi:DNA polymerase-3 subunit epsilon
MNSADLVQFKVAASQWARDLLARPAHSWVLLDTETTGLGDQAEMVQIGVINGAGKVLVDNRLVKPTIPIDPGAEAIHHISNAMVADAPSFPEVCESWLRPALMDRHLVIYNAAYDLRLLTQSAKAHRYPLQLGITGWACAMLQYAEWFGEWNSYHQSFRWQKLQGGDHSALGDCFATLELIKRMADG